MADEREFTVSMTVRIDPDVWEGAGYDPLDDNPDLAVRQVADWLTDGLYIGPDQVKVEVGHVGGRGKSVYPQAERTGLISAHRPVSQGEFHVLTLVITPGSLKSKDAEGNVIAYMDRVDRTAIIGRNSASWLRLAAQTLELVEDRTGPHRPFQVRS